MMYVCIPGELLSDELASGGKGSSEALHRALPGANGQSLY